MSSVPDGRAANQPLLAITLMPPIGALLPGALPRIWVIFSPAKSLALIRSGAIAASRFRCSAVALASTRSATGLPSSFAN